MEELVESLVNGDNSAVLTTSATRITKNMGRVGTVLMKKQLRAVMDKNVCRPDYTTTPYGYRLVLSMHRPGTAVSAFLNQPQTPLTTIRPGTFEWLEYCRINGYVNNKNKCDHCTLFFSLDELARPLKQQQTIHKQTAHQEFEDFKSNSCYK